MDRTRRVIAIVVVMVLALGGGAAYLITSGKNQTDAVAQAAAVGSSTPVVTAGSGSAESPAAANRRKRAEYRAGSDAPDSNEVSPFGAPGTLEKIPDHYEPSDSGGGGFYVNLAGGKATMYAANPTPMPPHHPLRVKVVDRERHPVVGALVSIEERSVQIMGGTVIGESGGQTDNLGIATFDVPNERAGFAVAVHPSGWSAVAPVAAGATELTLTIVGRGAVAGHLTYNGHGESFAIRLVDEAKTFSLMYESNPDGSFAIASLAPGAYEFSAGLAQGITGGASKFDKRQIVVEDGKTLTIEIAQKSATVIVVTPHLPAGTTVKIVAAYLFPGNAPVDPLTMRARAKAEHINGMLFGGQDANKPIQLHDIAPGSYSVCETGGNDLKSPPLVWACAAVTLLDGDQVREVDLQLVPVVATP